MLQLVPSPWVASFQNLLTQATTSLVLCAPYIGRGPCERVKAHLEKVGSSNFQLTFLTDLSRDNILSGATDVAALSDVMRALPTTVVRFLPSLHAKVYVADDKCAVVTSANFTDSGLARNFEYGVQFKDIETVQSIKQDVMQYASLGSPIDKFQLEAFATVVNELRGMREAAERSLRIQIRREFDRRLRKLDDELLHVRAAGRSAHAIFADVIRHLLRKGPMTTTKIHEAIKNIHPDLCDDSVDRVISGQHFGKKWKHGVRTAQVFLRRRGDIRLENGRWQLTA